jgi:hypothetical protein
MYKPILDYSEKADCDISCKYFIYTNLNASSDITYLHTINKLGTQYKLFRKERGLSKIIL